jgi:hypothetical protein
MIGVTICICVVLWSFGLFDGRGAGGDSSLFDGWDGGDGGDGGSD